jgi:hypothetical protein
MARLDIKSFEKGIEKIDEQIRKLEERKIKLRDKIHNTVECPTCHWYWDALYLVNVTKTIKVAKDVTDEKVEALWICPMCKTQIHQVFKDLSDHWYGEENSEEVLLEGSTDKVTKVKEIREKFN